ncbi:MAG: CopG family antitoxin [Candidatus Eremiobacteraeota bacterium]|nr:CopG family antitoxin [Candidatus Eremiobacteraeota bacterium]
MKKASIRDPELCQGCILCKDGKIPEFHNEEEEAEFWGNHSPLDFPDEFEDVDLHVNDMRQKKLPISIRLDPVLKEGVKKMAHIKKIRYQTLIQKWIKEKFEEEERALVNIATSKRR